MNTDMSESSSEEDFIIISNVCGFTGIGGGGGAGSSTNNGTSTLEISELQRKQKELTESLQREMGLQRDQMRKIEEKCHAILVKIPLLEHRAEDVPVIRRELELEREQRTENEKQFMECIDLLKEEILQLNLKVSNLETKIEDMDKQKGASNVPSTSSTSQEKCVSEVVGRLMNDLSIDLNVRFQKLEDNQEMLQAQIQNTRKDLSFFVTPTVEATLRRPSPSVIPASTMDTQVTPVNEFGEEYETEKASSSMPGVSPMAMDEPGHSKTVKPRSAIAPPDPVPAPVNFGAGDAPESPDDADLLLLHGQAPVPGRHLPLLCLCGLEYASSSSLAHHVMEELIGRTLNYESTTTLRPSQHAFASMSLSQALVTTASTPIPAPFDKDTVAHGIGKKLVDAAGKLKFYCKCGKRYSSLQNLQYHIRAVSSRALFHCHICWKQYSTIAILRFHMRDKHQMGYLKGKCVCSICGQMCNTKADLFAHRSASHNSKSAK